MEEHSSAMLLATLWIPTIATNQPQVIPPVPAYPIPYHSVDAKLGRSPRTAKLTQNVVQSVNSRLNSGLYPSAARTSSSAVHSLPESLIGMSPPFRMDVTGSSATLCWMFLPDAVLRFRSAMFAFAGVERRVASRNGSAEYCSWNR